MSLSWPTLEQAGECAADLASHLRGDASVDAKKAAWGCLGYGLSLASGQPAMMASPKADCPADKEEQAKLFDQFAAHASGNAAKAGGPQPVGAVPWALLFALAKQILDTLTAGR